jgi:hypothetical protein
MQWMLAILKGEIFDLSEKLPQSVLKVKKKKCSCSAFIPWASTLVFKSVASKRATRSAPEKNSSNGFEKRQSQNHEYQKAYNKEMLNIDSIVSCQLEMGVDDWKVEQ